MSSSPADPDAARPAAAADGPLLVAESGAPDGTGLILFGLYMLYARLSPANREARADRNAEARK